jgi:hypothetical protein
MSMRGKSATAIPGGTCRLGPMNEKGEARSEKIGSVNNVIPPNCASAVACPIHVTAGAMPLPATALARKNARSGATWGVGASAGGGSPLRVAFQRQRNTSARLFGTNSMCWFWKPSARWWGLEGS